VTISFSIQTKLQHRQVGGFKAFICGQMIGYTRHKHFMQMLEIEKEIKELNLEININKSIEKQQKSTKSKI